VEEIWMLPAFGWQAVLTRWQFAPVVTAAAAVAAGLYLWGARRVGQRHPARPWPAWRSALFLGGLAVVVIATESGIGTYDRSLFWDHMIQHLLLLMIAPPMLVAGQPVTLLLHASRNPLHGWARRAIRSRPAAFLTWPPFGLAAYTLTVAGTHLTGLAHLVYASPALHDAEHVVYLVAGYLFFLPLLGREPIRWRVSYPIRLLVLALAMPVDTFTGLVLGYQGPAFARAVAGARPPGSPGPVEDVHWAGAVMWIGGDAIMFGFMMLVVWAWSRDDRAAPRHPGWLEAARKASFEHRVAGAATALPAGRGDIDDDEHLAAYNAWLARLSQPAGPHGSPPGRGAPEHSLPGPGAAGQPLPGAGPAGQPAPGPGAAGQG
jgi:cytochrome c oxidase assembly factor CtaG